MHHTLLEQSYTLFHIPCALELNVMWVFRFEARPPYSYHYAWMSGPVSWNSETGQSAENNPNAQACFQLSHAAVLILCRLKVRQIPSAVSICAPVHVHSLQNECCQALFTEVLDVFGPNEPS